MDTSSSRASACPSSTALSEQRQQSKTWESREISNISRKRLILLQRNRGSNYSTESSSMPLLNFLSTTLLPLWRRPRRTRSQLLLVSVLTKTAATYSAWEHRWSFHGDAQAGCKMPSSTTSPCIPPQGHDRRKQGAQGRQCCCWRADSEIRAGTGCWAGWEGTRVLQVWEGGEPGPTPADGDGGGIHHAEIQAQIALQGALVLALLTWPRAAPGFLCPPHRGAGCVAGGVHRNQLRAR